MKTTTLAKTIADRCSDAYSADRYASWPAVAQTLLDRGYNEAETEEIMRSKWARWAADKSSSPRAASKHLVQWLDKSFKNRKDEREQVREMMGEAKVNESDELALRFARAVDTSNGDVAVETKTHRTTGRKEVQITGKNTYVVVEAYRSTVSIMMHASDEPFRAEITMFHTADGFTMRLASFATAGR